MVDCRPGTVGNEGDLATVLPAQRTRKTCHHGPMGAEPEEKPLLWTSECGIKTEEGMASGSEWHLDGDPVPSGFSAVYFHTLKTLKECDPKRYRQ